MQQCLQFSNKDRDLQFASDYQPHNSEVQQLRILIHGPTGSGRSSFFNSVDSALQGNVTGRALADAISHDSFTLKYKSYKIQKGGPGTFYPFVFTDIMGLDRDTNRGVSVEDIKLAMMGHIKDGYKFSPLCKITEDDNYYNNDPTLKDQVHVLVCVISAETSSILSDEHVNKMKDVRLAARDMGILEVAILTKMNEACPEVKKSIQNVYKSKYLKKQMEKIKVVLGIPLYSIFPVKNYHSEIDTDDDNDTLILSALRCIINLGEDFVNDQ
ncbi:interferon-induced protein 44-like [Epinephelus fuscoguttatus]|uniref:interferon-induced protein 44-like n=1 Tax=Epinephelus fuscoguttatus TaxID=293821 RepID=UPI0020D0E91A|nr:interferon-induced protein 44-like [Epinephelus fuscoguttatus]